MTAREKQIQEMQAAIQVAKVAYEAIREAGPNGLPSGHLYAAMMSVFKDLQTFESMVDMLVRSDLVQRGSNYRLIVNPLKSIT